jgi:RsiW-degrading membrane proteinase PrsW (M82 family)
MSLTENKKISAIWWVLTVVIAIYANSSFGLFRSENTSLFIASAISALVVYKVTRWADEYEHETKESLIWTGIFGSGISVLIAINAYSIIPDNLETNLVVSLVEESSKAIVLLPLLYLRKINSWTDGLVFGSMAGLGFSISEDFWYALDSESPLNTLIFREIYSIFGHSTFSAFMFAAICALYLHTRKKIFLLMTFLAIGSHWLWNAGIALIDVDDFFVYAIIPPATFVLLAFLLRSQEKSELEFLGMRLIESGNLTEEELSLASDLKLRKSTREKLSTQEQKSQFDLKVGDDVRKILEQTRTE